MTGPRVPPSVNRTLARWAAVASVIVAGGACWRIGTLPAMEFYTLTVPRPEDDDTVRHDPVLVGTMAIAPYDAPGIYGDPGIVFRIDDSQLHAYPSRRWAQRLGDMLGVSTESVLAARPLTATAAIFDPPSRSSHSYLWEGRVREFEEVDRGENVFAAVALDVRIVRTAGDSVVWTKSARLERPVPNPTMPAIVRTLSDLTAELIAQFADSARAALRVPAASSARPPS